MSDVKHIEWLADQYEVPLEQMMLVVATLQVSEVYWGSYYVGSESVIESILDKVFGV